MSRAARQWPASTSALAAEYLSAAQVAEFTPWSVDAIEKMIRRGTLKRDLHYFQPFGQRRQLLFKRSAIVALIERKSPEGEYPGRQRHKYSMSRKRRQGYIGCSVGTRDGSMGEREGSRQFPT